MNVEFSREELNDLIEGIGWAQECVFVKEDLERYNILFVKVCEALARAE